MNPLLPGGLRDLRSVLCIGAHCDDIEIGCGGALLEMRKRCPGMHLLWVVFSGDDVREAETRAAARRFGVRAQDRVDVQRFPTSYFPSSAREIKDAFEALKPTVQPDLIFTHQLYDRHQDHRLLAELTWNTFRDHTILEYEIAKFEGDLGQPNVYLPLSAEVADAKVLALEDCFPSQRTRPWFAADAFRALMRIRGIECNAPSGFAEAFHGRKLVL